MNFFQAMNDVIARIVFVISIFLTLGIAGIIYSIIYCAVKDAQE